MNAEAFKNKQYHLSVTAGMNQRIHQERASYWVCRDRAFKIMVGVLAIASLCLTTVAWSIGGYWWNLSSVVASSAAAVVAIILNVIPLADWASTHNALFQRWTDFREDVDALLFDLANETTPELKDRLKSLEAKQHRICGTEPAPKQGIIDRCYADELKSRKQVPATCT